MNDAPTINYLGELQLLKIQPGDKFVLMCEDRVSVATGERIQSYWKRFVGEGVPLLILDKGLRLGAIRTEEP